MEKMKQWTNGPTPVHQLEKIKQWTNGEDKAMDQWTNTSAPLLYFSIGPLVLVHCFIYSIDPLLYFSIGPLVLVHCFISSIG